jgi:hypothetical protein
MSYDPEARQRYFDESLALVRQWVGKIGEEINSGRADEITVNGLKAMLYYAETIAKEIAGFCEYHGIPVTDAGRLVLMLAGMGGFLVNGINEEIPAPMLMNIFSITGEHLVTDGTARTLLTELLNDLGPDQ